MTQNMSLAGFITHLGGVSTEMRHATHHALEAAAVLVEAEAKHSIGTYQPQSGPFVAWAELADATKEDRARKGFAENEPELRTGELRDSIGHKTQMTGPASGEAVIGSESQIAVWQELGTSKMPPRSILGGALVRKTDKVVALLGRGVVAGLVGQHVIDRYLPVIE